MKKCIYCDQDIQELAIKCRYCGEFLETQNFDKKRKFASLHPHGDYDLPHINRLIIIVILVILFILIFYIYKLDKEIEQTNNGNYNIKNQQHLIKSIVKIEYKDYSKNDRIGSGIIFSKDGLVLTNNHVIEDLNKGTSMGEINVCVLDRLGDFPDCEKKAELLIRNATLDLAIIKIKDFSTNDYINLFEGGVINTSLYGKTINIYGYPFLGGNKITITKGIISGFDDENNLKTDAEINGGNSGGGAFIGNNFIGLPTSILEDESGKIGYIISKNKIFSWFSSISKNTFKYNYSSGDFDDNKLNFVGNNIAKTSSFYTPDYIKFQRECVETYGIHAYYMGGGQCNCKQGYDFGEEDVCVLIE